jgi:hypothetical protein
MTIKKGELRIASLEDWLEHAAPNSKKPAKDQRSAREFAQAWLEGGGLEMPAEVNAALSAHPGFGPVLAWDAEPEAKLKFDSFEGETRNSDLAVIARDTFGPYVMAVEAKADESFGETVSTALAVALERRIKNPRSNGLARIDSLACMLLHPRVEKLAKAGDLRYPLLTACAGALAEAERRGSSRAVVLVHEFVVPATAEQDEATHQKKRQRNAADLAAFVSRLAGRAVKSVPEGELQGPFKFRRAGEVELYIGTVRRTLQAAKGS